MTKYEVLDKLLSLPNTGWFGVDFDRTLTKRTSHDPNFSLAMTGEPNEEVVKEVQKLLTKKIPVRIFTARMHNALSGKNSYEEVVNPIEKWCFQYLGQVLPITCIKDSKMIQLWDDRARTIIDGRVMFNKKIKELLYR